MTLNNFDVLHEQTIEPSPLVDSFSSEPGSTSSIISLGADVLALAYGTGGVLSLDPEHEDAKRYPNPNRPEDAKPPQTPPPTPPRG
jgi:hypothetical protein